MIDANKLDGIGQCRDSDVKLVARPIAVLKEDASGIEDKTVSSDNILHLVTTVTTDLPSASFNRALVVEPLARVR